jgi:hypothetical protein
MNRGLAQVNADFRACQLTLGPHAEGGLSLGRVGKYCKAYAVARLNEYEGWLETVGEVQRNHLYLHKDYVVTEGVFVDQDVVFDEVTLDWKDFCEETLGFEVPDFGSTRNQT